MEISNLYASFFASRDKLKQSYKIVQAVDLRMAEVRVRIMVRKCARPGVDY